LRSVSSNKIKVEPPEPVVAAEVTRSFELLRAAAGHMSPRRASPGQRPERPVRRSKGNGRGASGASIDACSQPEDEPRPSAKARKAEATGHSSGHIGPQPARKSEPANPEKPSTRIVVAHNGGNITGTSFKTKSASNMSASSRRSKPRSEASCPSELLETPRSEGCSVSRASPAASSRSRTSPSRERLALEKSAAEAAQRSAPVQLRTWIERAHQEASALYTSGALTGLRSPHRRSVSPPRVEFVIDVVDPRVAMFSHRSMSPVKNRRRSLPRQAGDASRQEGQPETAVAAQTLVTPAAPALAALPETLTASQPEELPKLPEAELAPPELPEPPEPEDKVKLDEFEEIDGCPSGPMTLESQLQTTQQQLEELQRQYLEVQQLLNEKRSTQWPGPSTRSPDARKPARGKVETPRDRMSPSRRSPRRSSSPPGQRRRVFRSAQVPSER